MILTRYDLQGQGFLLIVLALKNTGGARVDRARSQKPGSGGFCCLVLSQKPGSGVCVAVFALKNPWWTVC